MYTQGKLLDNGKSIKVEFGHSTSASNDFTVKAWSVDIPYSFAIVNAGTSIYAVRFHPASRNFLAYSGADHKVYYHDLRKPHVPLRIMEGHNKPVNYCHF